MILFGHDFDYPAVKLSINGELCSWEQISENKFRCNDIIMTVTYEDLGSIYRKIVDISSSTDLPTPDYLIVDYQTIPDNQLKMRGYIASSGTSSMELSDEEGGGFMPGCGYPLVGSHFFVGLEHQAGFNIVRDQNENSSTYELRQHPVWEDHKLVTMTAIIGKSENPEESYKEYLDSIKVSGIEKSLFSFCSFWSEPYTGNYEYVIGGENYKTFVEAFSKLNLTPDVYTLDAGWQDRNSIFEAKAAAGGEAGLVKLREFFESHNAKLSLWVSHNGPMGTNPEYLESIGVAVGSGMSSTYRGKGFGILMDKKLETLLTERFCQLVSDNINAVHLKMDWDNDCATNDAYKEKYPTRNHVREASVNVQNRIALAIRKANPTVKLRHGWWPSPWQLAYAEHLFLADSGDCEHSSIPSLTQRDCTFTARDIQYYHHFKRDGGLVPLNCIDNHDFPQAPRNPFAGDDGVWSNCALWAIMRGTSYQPWTLQPEALTDKQCNILRNTMAFARKYENILFNGKCSMIGGNPRLGEIYGFSHPLKDGKLISLRNPLPIPQKYTLDCINVNEEILQLYPDIRKLDTLLTFAPHEVKVIQITKEKIDLGSHPFQVIDGTYFYPSSATISKEISPMVSEVYQMPKFELQNGMDQDIPNGKRYWFKLVAPYRMNTCALVFRITGNNVKDIHPRIYQGRDARAITNCYALPITEIFSGNEGRGEYQNPIPKTNWGRFFQVQVPCGGGSFYRLELDSTDYDLELWAYGYESLSRVGSSTGPSLDGLIKVPEFSLGFVCTSKLEIIGHEEPVL